MPHHHDRSPRLPLRPTHPHCATGRLFVGLALSAALVLAGSSPDVRGQIAPDPAATRPRTIAPSGSQRVTLPAGTLLVLELLTPVHTRINGPGDEVTAQLKSSVRLDDGTLVLPRGTEVHGVVAAVSPARMPQRPARLRLVFDTLVTDLGHQPMVAKVVSIDDSQLEMRLHADRDGTVSGGRSGRRTVNNAIHGGWLGSIGAGVVILSGGPKAAAAGALGGGALGGVLLTHGNDIRLPQGTIVRLTLTKPTTIAL